MEIYIRRRNLMNIFLTGVTYIMSLTGIFIVLMLITPSNRLLSAILLIFTTSTGFMLAIKTSFNYRSASYKIAELNKSSEYNTIRLSYLEENNQMLRAIRHDTVNHMTVIAQFLKNCASESTDFNKDRIKMLNYINNFFDTISSETAYVSTGNIELDNLINSKLKLTEDEKISCEHHIFLPDNMSVDAFDLNTILGNLLDNAIQAIQKLHEADSVNVANNSTPDFPDIILSIMYDRGCIHIKVVNLCINNDISFEYNSDTNGFIVPDFLTSTKEDSVNHGFGIKNVINIVEKYSGTIRIQKNENLFLTNINIIM